MAEGQQTQMAVTAARIETAIFDWVANDAPIEIRLVMTKQHIRQLAQNVTGMMQ